VIGPLARGAEDLEIALTAMAGPDAIDGRGWTLTLPRSKKTSLRDFKVAVMLTTRTPGRSIRCRSRSASSPPSWPRRRPR
jgi:Asp-tRNA(Asn)/Glu-tRNA(Gln) amidotransferase A subunit family amidase